MSNHTNLIPSVYAGIHMLRVGLERQADSHGPVSLSVGGFDASQAGDLVRLCVDGGGIYGSNVNRPGSGSVLVDDPLGGSTMHLDLCHLTVTLPLVMLTDNQRATLTSMLRALSCGRCGEPLSWGDYEHHSGGTCFDCYHDALFDAGWGDEAAGEAYEG